MLSAGVLRSVALVRTDFLPRCMLQLPVTANVVPSSPILVTLMMEVIRSLVTSVHKRDTRRHVLEDGVLQYSCWLVLWTQQFPSSDMQCHTNEVIIR
jgi:hypothetical protein